MTDLLLEPEALDAVPPPASIETTTPRVERFAFSGSTRDYFGIWIVNLFLTIITLGIYSAWAKVRKKRYFYGHTWLAQSNFEYHGNPIAILKGRLIAFAAFVAYTLASGFHPRGAAWVLLALSPAIPWLLVRSMKFNAVNSSWRNVRFHFTGEYRRALVILSPLVLIPLIGLFGPEPANAASAKFSDLWPLFVAPLVFAAMYPYVAGAFKLFHVNGSSFGGARFGCGARVRSFYAIYAVAFGIMVILIMIFSLVMGVAFFLGKYGWVLIPLVYVGLGAVLIGYTQSRVNNLVVNATSLGGTLQFRSSLSARKLARLYAENVLAIVCTLGMAIPWASIRAARYRLECLSIECDGPLDGFVHHAEQAVGATGEGVSDVFDVDLAL
jgi:uncharacterized membrane protein YjgN (DUF898 family)